MNNLSRALCALPLAATIFATPAAAASQFVDLDLTPPDANGVFTATGEFTWIAQGMQAIAYFNSPNLKGLEFNFTWQMKKTTSHWDVASGAEVYADEIISFECSPHFGGLCYGDGGNDSTYLRLRSPMGFDKKCRAQTIGDCSLTYIPLEAQVVGTFQIRKPWEPWDLELWVGGASAIPEPSTWALMISGFGLTGFALRRARRTVSPR